MSRFLWYSVYICLLRSVWYYVNGDHRKRHVRPIGVLLAANHLQVHHQYNVIENNGASQRIRTAQISESTQVVKLNDLNNHVHLITSFIGKEFIVIGLETAEKN